MPFLPIAQRFPGEKPRDPRLILSVSQHQTFEMCPRKWWLDKRAKVRPAQKKYLAFGGVLHGVAERYQRREPLYPAGWDSALTADEAAWVRSRAILAIAAGLWQSDPSRSVEKPFCALLGQANGSGRPILALAETSMTPSGVRVVNPPTLLADGKPIPIAYRAQPYLVGFMDVLDVVKTIPEVHDHKTAKNKKYAKTNNSLKNDLQMQIYSAIALAMRPDASEVKVTHNIFLKDPEVEEKDSVYAVSASIYADEAMTAWNKINNASDEMKIIAETIPVGVGETRANNYEKIHGTMEPKACNAYGKCPYYDACHGHKNIIQVVRTLDDDVARAAAPQPPRQIKSPVYVLKPSAKPFTRTSGASMPFPAPAATAKQQPAPATIGVGSEGYVTDPEIPVQYRCHVYRVAEEVYGVMLWTGTPPARPAKMDEATTVPVPRKTFSLTPFPNLPIQGYGEPEELKLPVKPVSINVPATAADAPPVQTAVGAIPAATSKLMPQHAAPAEHKQGLKVYYQEGSDNATPPKTWMGDSDGLKVLPDLAMTAPHAGKQDTEPQPTDVVKPGRGRPRGTKKTTAAIEKKPEAPVGPVDPAMAKAIEYEFERRMNTMSDVIKKEVERQVRHRVYDELRTLFVEMAKLADGRIPL